MEQNTELQVIDSINVQVTSGSILDTIETVTTFDVEVIPNEVLNADITITNPINVYTDDKVKLNVLSSSLEDDINELSSKIDNIDFSSVEKKIDTVNTLVSTESQTIQEKIDAIPAPDLTNVAKESTLQEESAAIQSKIDNIKLPEIDTTELAKQGTNAEATLTAIYQALQGSDEPTQDIPEGVAERLALILEFFGIKTLDGYEFMTEQEVYDELEVIMTTMDGDLTAEMAASITEETISLVKT